jgi:hypothetical protein
MSADGSKLYIDNKTIIQNDRLHKVIRLFRPVEVSSHSVYEKLSDGAG